MQVTFLGTGTSQGVPVIGCQCHVCQSVDVHDKRLRSSVQIIADDVHLVIDTGPDFRQQILRSGLHRLDALLFTHGHKDHTAGFDDIRAFNFIQQKDMDVYLDERVEQIIKKDYDYIFATYKYPGIPKAKLHIIDNKPFSVKGLQIIPILVYHYRLPVFGFRIKDFTYITDCNHIPDEEMEKIMGSKVVVLNALRKEKHISHFNLEEALEMMEKIKPEQGYITHISHQLGTHDEINRILPPNIKLAHDELVLQW